MTNEGKHKVALAVAERLGIDYEVALPLAKRAVRVLGADESIQVYTERCRTWREGQK